MPASCITSTALAYAGATLAGAPSIMVMIKLRAKSVKFRKE
jgi:hypothetical protein